MATYVRPDAEPRPRAARGADALNLASNSGLCPAGAAARSAREASRSPGCERRTERLPGRHQPPDERQLRQPRSRRGSAHRERLRRQRSSRPAWNGATTRPPMPATSSSSASRRCKSSLDQSGAATRRLCAPAGHREHRERARTGRPRWRRNVARRLVAHRTQRLAFRGAGCTNGSRGTLPGIARRTAPRPRRSPIRRSPPCRPRRRACQAEYREKLGIFKPDFPR